jgi:hypothetical protein
MNAFGAAIATAAKSTATVHYFFGASVITTTIANSSSSGRCGTHMCVCVHRLAANGKTRILVAECEEDSPEKKKLLKNIFVLNERRQVKGLQQRPLSSREFCFDYGDTSESVRDGFICRWSLNQLECCRPKYFVVQSRCAGDFVLASLAFSGKLAASPISSEFFLAAAREEKSRERRMKTGGTSQREKE